MGDEIRKADLTCLAGLEQAASYLGQRSQAIGEIKDEKVFLAVGEDMKRIKAQMGSLVEEKDRASRPYTEELARISGGFQPPLAILETALSRCKGLMEQYKTKLANRNRQEEAKAAEAARLEAEELREQADLAESEGSTEMAQELREQADMMIAPPIADEPPKISGLSERETWHADVHDIKLLCGAVAIGSIPTHTVEPNMKFFNSQAKALKSEMDKLYPGVRAVSSISIAVSGRGAK